MSNQKKINYAHLHVHSSYSLLDGISQRSDLIRKAKEFGQPGLAMTEHGNIFAAISFYKDCMAAGVIPIIGMEAYIAPDTRFGRSYAKKGEAEDDAKNGDLSMSAYHLTILSKNRDGYENLKTLSTLAYREGFYRKPRIDDEILEKYKDGLIVLSGCLASKTSRLIVAGQTDKAIAEVDKMRSLFGDDFFLEVMDHNIEEERVVRDALIDFGKKHGIGMVMTGDSHYTEHGDSFAHEVALAIGTNKTVIDPDHWKFQGEGYWFKSSEEMAARAEEASIPAEALTNAWNIAKRVQDYGFSLASKTKKPSIPLFRDASGNAYTNDDCHLLLHMKAMNGLVERGVSGISEYDKRLEEELETIKSKDFSSYFLIIADIVDFMRSRGILAPIGRGSSVGSLVCYSLFITGLDPVKYSVPFSRFINPGRKDLPDIDTDISQERRKEVIDYIVSKYGADRVAQIVTFQTMGAKAAVDNVGRALGVPSAIRRQVGKIIGDITKDDKLDELVEANPKLDEMLKQVPNWYDVARKLEGLNKNLGAHAAGIVIANKPLIEHTPLSRDSADGHLTTQFDMKDLSELGLLKLDMLGLKTLDLIQHTLEMVEAHHGIKLDFQNIATDDPDTYKLIAGGRYVSVFQYDSHGIRAAAKQLQPATFDHLVALNALYRPGPMLKDPNTGKSIMDQYIDRRHGREPIETWHPELDSLFAPTLGLCLFQEGVMSMTKIIAGFNDLEADEYRAAIGKKDAVKFEAAQNKFIQRGIEFGRPPTLMKSLADKLEGFARYGWNIGHCLRRGTKVLTCDRGYVDIQDIRQGEQVWSVGHKTGHLFRNTVKNVINNGVRSLRRITAGHTSIDCTDAHRFLTSEKGYVHAAELVGGDCLKILEQGAATAYLNIDMAFGANSDQVPQGVPSDDVERYNMMDIELASAATKGARAAISGQNSGSEGSRSLSSANDVDTWFSKELINTLWIDKDAPGSESLGYCELATKSGIDNLLYHDAYFRSDSIDFVANETPLLHFPRKTSLTSLELKSLEDSVTTKARSVPALNKRASELIRAGRISADMATDLFGPSAYLDVDTAANTAHMFSAAIDDMGIAIPSNNVGRGCEDDAAMHTNIVSSIHGTIIHDRNVTSNVALEESDEVWDLEMELDANFIANDIVVHNSLAYSYISYVTAYLEAHYPHEYYTNLLNVNLDKADELKVLLSSILRAGAKISTPDINKSGARFHTDGKSIYMGLLSVRNLGENALEVILKDREENGQYHGYIDFNMRMAGLTKVNKLVKENLVKAGAFNWDTSLTSKDMIENTELVGKIIKKFHGKLSIQDIAKAVAEKLVITNTEYSHQVKLSNERAVLNFYISSHPVTEYMPLLTLLPHINFITPSQLQSQDIGTHAVMLGMVDQRDVRMTKTNKPYIKLVCSDQFEAQYFNIWEPLATKYANQVIVNQAILMKGAIRDDKLRPGENQMLIDGVLPITTVAGGIPVKEMLVADEAIGREIASILGVGVAAVSSIILKAGHRVVLDATAYLRPEHYAQLRQFKGRVHYEVHF